MHGIQGFRPAGPPVIEMYHENRINASLSLNHTHIYIAVERVSRVSPSP